MADVTYAKAKVGGAVSCALYSSTLTIPEDAKTALASDFKSLGYISEDGMTNANSPSNDTIKAWGGDEVLTVLTEKPDTFKFKLIEATNTDVLKVIYGSANVTGDLTSGIEVSAKAEEPEETTFVVDMVMKGDVLKRIVIPHGYVNEVSEVAYKDSEAVGYEVTVKAMPDSTGVTHKEYIVK